MGRRIPSTPRQGPRARPQVPTPKVLPRQWKQEPRTESDFCDLTFPDAARVILRSRDDRVAIIVECTREDLVDVTLQSLHKFIFCIKPTTSLRGGGTMRKASAQLASNTTGLLEVLKGYPGPATHKTPLHTRARTHARTHARGTHTHTRLLARTHTCLAVAAL